VLQPFFMMLMFTLLFHRVAKVPTPVAYPVFAFAGLLPWQLFSFGLNESSNSLVANQRLITKIYFPRVIMPLSAIMAGLVDFGIAFGLLVGMMIWYHVVPSLTLLLLPFFVLLTMLTSLSVGFWLSALNVKYRDVRYTLGFLVQFWMLATPVAYPIAVVPEKWRGLYALNPMTGVVEGFRWALLGVGDPPGFAMAASVVLVVLLLLGGLEYFRRMERTFADTI
jgi:lipopolysaccharide transport system permease protein